MASALLTINNKRFWVKDKGSKGFEVHNLDTVYHERVDKSDDKLELDQVENKLRLIFMNL